ncbi:MAG: DUF3369 domain-containing protein [Magnetococcus sp. YQC-3]
MSHGRGTPGLLFLISNLRVGWCEVQDMQQEKRVIQLTTKSGTQEAQAPGEHSPWQVLVVDDDPDVIAITRLNLRNFSFAGRSLELISATSNSEAKEILLAAPGFALGIIDVVMETDDAGLQLVKFIREDLGDRQIRLVIRTGQPGHAPERYVIDNFDIDDYKEKSDLSAQKLYTTVRSALKSYRDLVAIDLARTGLETILQSAPHMYLHSLDSFEAFYSGVFTQILGLCHLDVGSKVKISNGFLATFDKDEIVIKAKIGEIPGNKKISMDQKNLSATETLIPLKIQEHPIGLLYLEHAQPLDPLALHLIQIFTGQVAVALQVLHAQLDLRKAHASAIQMLSEAAEAKDAETGEHINRIVDLTRRLSLAMGILPEMAEEFAVASQLHDVGKIGIPDNILNKPGPLDAKEFAIIKTHPRIGAMIIKDEKHFRTARDIALYHHEKWDGSGYPEGLRGEAIPLSARIVSVVDVFDALVSRRPYKKAWSNQEAIAEICRLQGTGFDPVVVEAFSRMMASQ